MRRWTASLSFVGTLLRSKPGPGTNRLTVLALVTGDKLLLTPREKLLQAAKEGAGPGYRDL